MKYFNYISVKVFITARTGANIHGLGAPGQRKTDSIGREQILKIKIPTLLPQHKKI